MVCKLYTSVQMGESSTIHAWQLLHKTSALQLPRLCKASPDQIHVRPFPATLSNMYRSCSIPRDLPSVCPQHVANVWVVQLHSSVDHCHHHLRLVGFGFRSSDLQSYSPTSTVHHLCLWAPTKVTLETCWHVHSRKDIRELILRATSGLPQLGAVRGRGACWALKFAQCMVGWGL